MQISCGNAHAGCLFKRMIAGLDPWLYMWGNGEHGELGVNPTLDSKGKPTFPSFDVPTYVDVPILAIT